MKRMIMVKICCSLLFIGLIYLQCNKKALDVPPPTQSEASYFVSETEFRTAIIGTYAGLTDFYSSSNTGGGSGSAEMEIQFLPGDDLTNNTGQVYEEFGNGLNSSDGLLNQYFKSCYILIGRANKVLQKIATVKDGVFTTPGLKNNIEGEALFLRAFGHFQLWNIFGTAPLDTAVILSSAQFNPSSSKGTELLDQAIEDLTKAAPLLPASWGSVDVGRVTANGGYGLLGKCLLFRANVNNASADYLAAIAAFDQISGAALVPNFEDNFDVYKENNEESLFEFQAGANIKGAGNTNAWLSNDQCDCGVASAYWQCFIEGSGTYMGGNLYTPTVKLQNIFDPADPRLPLTMNAAKDHITKYVLKDSLDGQVNSVNNPRVLRYADVLLLKAEAVLQSGGNTADAIGLINTVRARARNMVGSGTIPADLDATQTDKNTIMQWIMDERLRELAAEGQRWYDLRRWQLAGFITMDNAFFSSIVPTRIKFDAHFLYFPIPNGETDKNPNIVQNPGY